MLRRGVVRPTGERGDTLIEVMLAFSILSAVIVGTFIIMNQGIATAQNSLEINLVRNQVDTQAELLRHLNNGKLTSIGRASNEVANQWDQAVVGAAPGIEGAQDYDYIDTIEKCTPSELPNRVFFIDPRTGKVIRKSDAASGVKFRDSVTFAQIQEDPSLGESVSNMLWVEAVQSPSPGIGNRLHLTRYYDFHIRACWEGSGPDTGLLKLGTIVRLYVPREG